MRHTDICRCDKCGRLFDGRDCKKVEESRGEFWGFPAFETMWYSPCCTDDFHKLTEAEVEELTEEELEDMQ